MAESPNQRYSRQIRFGPIGAAGQRRLGASAVTLIGCGGLGTVLADILVRAGVGRLRIVDRDIVEESNLQRQLLFDEADVREGLPKAEAARRKLSAVNAGVEIEAVVADFEPTCAMELTAAADCLIDATDNFEARYLLNDVAVSRGVPWVYGAVVGSQGMTATIVPGRTPCLRCLYESAPPAGMAETCDTAGIISPIAHIIAGIQAAEAMKVLVCGSEAVRAHMIVVDVWEHTYKRFSTDCGRNPECPVCVRREFAWLNADQGSYGVSMCGRNAVQIAWKEQTTLDLGQLADKLAKHGKVRANPFLLRFDAEDISITVFPDGRAIIEGTEDLGRAREIYTRYIG